jgi:cytoplasmic iron level regulating protein YaaA (DUF328/UPF0246 family)
MIVLLSPSKTLDFNKHSNQHYTLPRLLKDSNKLVEVLKTLSPADIKQLMKVSDNIAELNFERFHQFETPFSLDNAKQALLAFKGDVYIGFEVETMSDEDLDFAQKHLRILSGLYGVLRPLDLMQPYRLEMGTKLAEETYKDLYAFWGNRITNLLNDDIALLSSNLVINLASNEYFKAINKELLNGRLLNIDFKENRNGGYRTISFNAKKARGAMAHQIVKHRVTEDEGLKSLVVNDYTFNNTLSTKDHFVFTK